MKTGMKLFAIGIGLMAWAISDNPLLGIGAGLFIGGMMLYLEAK